MDGIDLNEIKVYLKRDVLFILRKSTKEAVKKQGLSKLANILATIESR